MDFEAEEVVRLREEILRFVLQQLKETAATGELRKASAELAAPIGDAVEAAVQRAMERAGGGANAAAKARLGDVEINKIARAVSAQLGTGTRRSVPQDDALPVSSGPAEGIDLIEDELASPSRRSGRSGFHMSLEHWIALGLTLLLGIAIGIGIVKLMGPGDQSLVGSEAAQVLPEDQPVATSDSQLQQVEAPPRPASSGTAQQGSQTAGQ
jgi:hypothetical protein